MSFNKYVWEKYDLSDAHSTVTVSPKTLHRTRILFFLMHLLYLSKCFYQQVVISQSKYLTIWGFYFLIVYFGGHALLGNHVYETEAKNSFKNSLRKFLIVLGEITYAVEVLITIFFWAFLYEIVKAKYPNNPYFLYEQIYLHGVCFLTIFIDYSFNNHKFHSRHVAYILILTLVYGGFNAAYSLLVEPIYAVITYRHLKDYLFVLIAFFLFLAGFLAGTLHVNIRGRINASINQKTKIH